MHVLAEKWRSAISCHCATDPHWHFLGMELKKYKYKLYKIIQDIMQHSIVTVTSNEEYGRL